MRKQVSFAESQRNHRLQQDEALQRSFGMDASKMALKDPNVNLNNGVKINRPAIARCDSQQQHVTTIKIPKSLTAGPHLKHAALSPAQRKYLCSVAASHSPARVRQLITQHYINVLHRCIPAGARIRLLDEEEEEGPEDFLSDCFSSLSMEGWEDDTFSDL
ncbi:Protein FAM216A [Dissostichus eleginoides]|uniref:Protein FAM216A n=1 Tax=Dissostichus eleginoides TaxID=100907 RepID=A0AAD9FA78_DISEL|nr:Protein FAM216A [Dissostichus eleginoides]